MKVYRVEDKDGNGPYCGHRKTFVHRLHNMTHCRRSPCEEFMIGVWTLTDHRFGFASYEQLVAWFDCDHAIIERAGYFVAVYEVDENDEDDEATVIKGRDQVAFLYTAAKRIAHIAPTYAIELFDAKEQHEKNAEAYAEADRREDEMYADWYAEAA